MLRFMHRNQQYMGAVVLIGAIALAMSGFGFRMFDRTPERVAVTVNGQKIQFEEFDRARRSVDARYRQMLGSAYGQFAKTLLSNVNDQAKDHLIEGALVDQLAEKSGLALGEQSVRESLVQGLFGGSFDRAAYENYLMREGLTPEQFERTVARDLRRNNLVNLLADVMQATPMEAQVKLAESMSSFATSYVVFEPKTFEVAVKEPDEAALKGYFEEHKQDYALPLRASYQYAVARADALAPTVEVPEEELSFYFSEHENDFMHPAKAHIRQIVLNFAPNATAEQIKAVKDRADDIYNKLNSGAGFDALALENSDDLVSKTSGGDLGWVNKGAAQPQEVNDKIFSQKASGLLTPIETPSGYVIVKIEDFQAARPKEFSEVKAEILTILQKRDAPDAALQAAEKTLDLVLKGTDLQKAIEGTKLVFAKTEKLLAASENPSADLAGLTAKVLEFPDDTKSDLVQLPNAYVVVVVSERLEPEVPDLAAVKDKVIQAFKTKEQKRMAREAAVAFLEKAKASGIEAAAQEQKLELKSAKDITREKGASDVLAAGDVKEAIFSTPVGALASDVLDAQGRFVVLKVTEQKKPSAEELEKRVKSEVEAESKRLGNLLYRSIVNEADAKATIDVDANLVGS